MRTGGRASSITSIGMFAFALCEHASGRLVLARDRLGIKPLYLAEPAARCGSPRRCRRCSPAGGIDTALDPVALHHYLSWHAVVPAPRTILRGVRKLPPATVMVVEPDGRRHQRASTGARISAAPPEHADWARERLGAGRAGRAADRGAPAHGRRRARRRAALRRSRLEPDRRAAGRGRPARTSRPSASGSTSRRARGRRVPLLRPDRRAFDTDHHRFHVPTERMLPALDGAIAAMSEPMVSHDAVAFYLLSQEVSPVTEGRPVRAGRRRGLRRLLLVSAAARRAPATAPTPTGRRSSTAPHAELAETLQAGHLLDDDPESRRFSSHFARPGAEQPVDRALRLDTEIMLVDDPVKRVDNMTMAWGLEARTPFLDHELVELAAACPPELKLAHGGKGVLKTAARRSCPTGHRPAQGLLPGAGPVDAWRARRWAHSRDAGRRRRPGARAVPARAREQLFAAPQRAPDHARGIKALAARAARAVAEPAWDLSTPPDRRPHELRGGPRRARRAAAGLRRAACGARRHRPRRAERRRGASTSIARGQLRRPARSSSIRSRG